MMMYFIRLLVLPVAITFIAGCGLFASDNPYDYRQAESGKPLEMPEGLAMSRAAQQDHLPTSTAEPGASVEELEKPPEIIKSADLKFLDAEDASGAKSQQAAPVVKEKPIELAALSITATKNTNGDSLLLVDAEFDKVWPRVKPALEELGFNIDDSSRGRELYAISKSLPAYEFTDKPVHPADEKPEVKEEFQIHVKPSDSKTQITVHNKFGQLDGSGLADHLLLQIKELMEKPR